MKHKEPSDAAHLAARLARAYSGLSPYSAATLAESLCAIERAQRRHAVRCCNGAPDVRRKPERGELFGYCKLVPLPPERDADPTAPRGMCWTDDTEAEFRASKRIESRLWAWRDDFARRIGQRDDDICRLLPTPRILRHGDPRGCVLSIQCAGEPEAQGV